MKSKLALSLLFTLISLPVFAQTSFEQNFNQHLQYKKNVQPKILEYAKKFEFVFVGGFLNEGIPGYFKDNIDSLLHLGIASKNIHTITPSSVEDYSFNTMYIYDILNDIVALENKKIVLIAHSKGASETLSVILSHQKFSEENIHKAYLVQGALKGSSVADYISGDGQPPSLSMPIAERLWFWAAGKSGRILDPIINKGMTSLTHTYAKNYWDQLFKRYGHPNKSVSNIIKYIASYQHPRSMSEVVDCTGWYLQTTFGLNDGLVELKDQFFSEFGELVAVIDADHADLMTSSPISNARPKVRYALTRSIILDLAKNDISIAK